MNTSRDPARSKREKRMAACHEPDALLFAAQHGGHLAPSTLNRHIYAARQVAGRPDLRFHDLRRSARRVAPSVETIGRRVAPSVETIGRRVARSASRECSSFRRAPGPVHRDPIDLRRTDRPRQITW